MDTKADAGLAPVSTPERVQELDVLRGIALFGILVVNIDDYAPAPVSTADGVTQGFINVVAHGSFYPLFSLLFGIGFALFLERATARGTRGVRLYVRRLVSLLAIALLQIILLEDRNILVIYAFLAVPLLLFWRASARTCLIAAMACLTLAVVRVPINRALARRQDPAAAAATRAEQARRQAEWRRVADTRSYLEIAAYRAQWEVPAALRWSANLRRNPRLLHILAMFLLGAAVWRSRLLLNPSSSRRLLRTVVVAGIIGGVVGNLVVILGPDSGPLPWLASRPITTTAVGFLGNTLLTLAYVAGVVLVMSGADSVWRRRLAPLAVIGRMGLTNYLWQSVVMSLLFLPYGLRLEGAFALWIHPLFAVVIFLTHLPLSTWWLARFRFGPAEWIWRTATYGRVQPMRLRTEEARMARPA